MVTILIVTGEPDDRQWFVRTLEGSDHRLLEASEGAEALERVRAERPDLVFVNILMPRMDGFEFVHRLRAEPAIAGTPVVFFTADFCEQETRPLAEACGVPHLITKPFTAELILRTMQLALSTRPPAQVLQLETIDSERLLTNKIAEKAKELKATNRRLLEVQEAERARLARELHDELGQLLAAANYKLHVAKELAGPHAPHALIHLEECSSIVQQASEQVRKLAFDLRPVILDVLGLEPALHVLADRHRQLTGQEVQMNIHLTPLSLRSEQPFVCFRIIQEALANAARHAHAKRVTVELRHDENWADLVVQDDGVGFAVADAEQRAQKEKTFGLLGMKERANLIGGQIDVRSAPGLGTTIHLRLPLSRKEGNQ